MSDPQEIYNQVTSDTLRAEAKLAEMQSEILRLKKRIKDAQKLLSFLEKTYDITRPKETLSVSKAGERKPEGISVIDGELECPECGFQAGGIQGLVSHARMRHSLTFSELRSKQKAK